MKSQTNPKIGKKIVILGGGGFIGGHLAKRLKEEGNHVRICDIKKHEHFFHEEICHEFILGDLTDPKVVDTVIEEDVDEREAFSFYIAL